MDNLCLDIIGLDFARIPDLATPIAQAGAIHGSADLTADDVFDYTVGIAILIYEQDHPR